MTPNDIIRKYIEDDLLRFTEDFELAEDDDLLLSGKLNSLGVLRLVAFLQEEFACEIPPEDIILENFSTVNSIANYIHQKTG